MKYDVIEKNREKWKQVKDFDGFPAWIKPDKKNSKYIEKQCVICGEKCLQHSQAHRNGKPATCNVSCGLKYYIKLHGPMIPKGTNIFKKYGTIRKKGQRSWNTGLTKETDERVAKTAEKCRGPRPGISSWNKGLTAETDQRIKDIAEKNRGQDRRFHYKKYHIDRICPICNNKFDVVRSSKQTYCSVVCANKSMIGKPSANKGIKKSEETRKKISMANKGNIVSEETRKKLSMALKGRSVWNKGKKNIFSQDALNKIKYANRNKQITPEFRQKMRDIALERIEKHTGQIQPNYNPSACEIFNKINEKYFLNGVHAENSGEYRVPKLGCFLDFYDKKTNIAIEFCEPYHYKSEMLKKDRIRSKEIMKDTSCVFIQIKHNESEQEIYKKIENVLS